MKPFKIGQVAKFHTPFPDEDPNQLYVVLELIEDQERSRARIQPLNTGLSLPPQTTVLLSDLEAELVKTNDLIGHQVYLDKEDKSKVRGKVLSAMEEEVFLDLNLCEDGVKTNVFLTVEDSLGIQHTGTLFVKMK